MMRERWAGRSLRCMLDANVCAQSDLSRINTDARGTTCRACQGPSRKHEISTTSIALARSLKVRSHPTNRSDLAARRYGSVTRIVGRRDLSGRLRSLACDWTALPFVATSGFNALKSRRMRSRVERWCTRAKSFYIVERCQRRLFNVNDRSRIFGARVMKRTSRRQHCARTLTAVVVLLVAPSTVLAHRPRRSTGLVCLVTRTLRLEGFDREARRMGYTRVVTSDQWLGRRISGTACDSCEGAD